MTLRNVALLVLTLFYSDVLLASPDPGKPYRQEVANEVYAFLYAHALCVEDGPTEPPCDWVYAGAYSLHWAAKELYSTKPLKEIKMPVSDWSRGGFTPYSDPVAYLDHEMLLYKIYLLINFGGVPQRHQ